jgi:hypothetical protein
MTRVIKETIFHPYHWMNGLSCHLRSLEIYLIIVLNTHYRFVFQMTPLLKTGHLTTLNPNNSM